MKRFLYAVTLAILLFAPFSASSAALAEEGVTLVLKSGVVVFLRDGYKQLVLNVKGHSAGGSAGRWYELNLDGHPFLVDLNEIAILCRERCDSMTILRRPAGTK
jgi:hypothetical protein